MLGIRGSGTADETFYSHSFTPVERDLNAARKRACAESCDRGPGRSGAGCGAVDGGVQGGVVVHLELTVDFEAAAAFEYVGPEAVEAEDEVFALLFEEEQAVAVAVLMAGGGIGAPDLLLGVVELEGEDGEAVDHEARALGVQFGQGGGQAGGFERLEQQGVAALGEVVAVLVIAVDGALDLGQIMVGGVRGTGAVFGVPEVEVGTMLREHQIEEIGAEDVMRVGIVVPESGGAVVEAGDLARVEMKAGGHEPVKAMVEHRGSRMRPGKP